jgi:ABC-type multidrug transport system ATPase subunit
VIAAWLAVALLRDTPVVILDDPSRGVSGQDSQQLIESLGELRRRGKTVLMATGDALFAGQLANRIVILKAGRKIAERRGSEVFGMSVAKLYLDYAGRVPTRVPS